MFPLRFLLCAVLTNSPACRVSFRSKPHSQSFKLERYKWDRSRRSVNRRLWGFRTRQGSDAVIDFKRNIRRRYSGDDEVVPPCAGADEIDSWAAAPVAEVGSNVLDNTGPVPLQVELISLMVTAPAVVAPSAGAEHVGGYYRANHAKR